MKCFKIILTILLAVCLTGCRENFRPYDHMCVILRSAVRECSDDEIAAVMKHVDMSEEQCLFLENALRTKYSGAYEVKIHATKYQVTGENTEFICIYEVTRDKVPWVAAAYFKYTGNTLVEYETHMVEKDLF